MILVNESGLIVKYGRLRAEGASGPSEVRDVKRTKKRTNFGSAHLYPESYTLFKSQPLHSLTSFPSISCTDTRRRPAQSVAYHFQRTFPSHGFLCSCEKVVAIGSSFVPSRNCCGPIKSCTVRARLEASVGLWAPVDLCLYT